MRVCEYLDIYIFQDKIDIMYTNVRGTYIWCSIMVCKLTFLITISMVFPKTIVSISQKSALSLAALLLNIINFFHGIYGALVRRNINKATENQVP